MLYPKICCKYLTHRFLSYCLELWRGVVHTPGLQDMSFPFPLMDRFSLEGTFLRGWRFQTTVNIWINLKLPVLQVSAQWPNLSHERLVVLLPENIGAGQNMSSSEIEFCRSYTVWRLTKANTPRITSSGLTKVLEIVYSDFLQSFWPTVQRMCRIFCSICWSILEIDNSIQD